MTLYNYSIRVNYDGKTRYYTNNVSIPFNRLQEELKELYLGIDELNGIIENIKIMEVK